MVKENIHECWSLTPLYDNETGELITHGLYALGGSAGDGAIRELKKRCVAEMERGKPLVGCAMYSGLVMGWAKKALQFVDHVKGTKLKIDFASDLVFRKNIEKSLLLVGEQEIVDIIEDTWSRHQGEDSIPDAERMDVEEEIAVILTEEYCAPSLEPGDFSAREIKHSKEIASSLGVRKPRRKRTPAPEEELVEPAPEPEEELVEPAPEPEEELVEPAPEPEEEPAPARTSGGADTATMDAIDEAVRKATE